MAPPQEPLSVESTFSIASSSSSNNNNNKFTLKDLIQSIHQVLGDEGLDSERIDANKIIQLMEQYSSNAEDWSQYTLFDHSRAYTRNLIDDGNGKFNLMILAIFSLLSPIHDHSGSHCVMKILDGELQETLYDWPQSSSADEDDATPFDITANAGDTNKDACLHEQQPLHISRDTVYQPNQVTIYNNIDKIGLHRISNPNGERGAVSLHLYTPPYKMCKTFEEKTGRARSSGVCSFYSIGGNRIE